MYQEQVHVLLHIHRANNNYKFMMGNVYIYFKKEGICVIF